MIGSDPLILGTLLALAALVTLPIAGTAAIAYHRRRDRSYLFVALALFGLVARIAVAAGTIVGVVPDASHHLVEHALDVTIASLLVGAVLSARSIDPRTAGERE